MTGITRRLAMSGIIAAAASPALANYSNGVCAMWEQRQAIVDRMAEALARYDAALATIPAWARPGPKHLISSGEFAGITVGAPLDTSIKPPTADHAGVHRVCRVSFEDIRERFEFNTRMFPHQRSVYRAKMRESFRKLIPLYRAQEAEYRRAGIAAIEQEQEELCDEQWEVDRAIRACSPSPQRTAACILIEAILHGHGTDTADSDGGMAIATLALADLRPHLSGLLTEHVTFFLQDRERPLQQMPFWGA